MNIAHLLHHATGSVFVQLAHGEIPMVRGPSVMATVAGAELA